MSFPTCRHAGRWGYQTVPMRIKMAAGIDHISIDFNPCGHPPFNAFTVPHYDVHIYKVDPEYRACMTCMKPIGVPICDPTPGARITKSNISSSWVSDMLEINVFSKFKSLFLGRAYTKLENLAVHYV